MINKSDYCIVYYDENYLPPRRKNSRRDITDYQPKSGTAVAYDYETKLRISLDVMLKLLEPTMIIIVGIIALIVLVFGYKHFNEMFTQAFF